MRISSQDDISNSSESLNGKLPISVQVSDAHTWAAGYTWHKNVEKSAGKQTSFGSLVKLRNPSPDRQRGFVLLSYSYLASHAATKSASSSSEITNADPFLLIVSGLSAPTSE